MRSGLITAALAVGAIASPLRKRDIVTDVDWVDVTVTITVTEDGQAAATSAASVVAAEAVTSSQRWEGHHSHQWSHPAPAPSSAAASTAVVTVVQSSSVVEASSVAEVSSAVPVSSQAPVSSQVLESSQVVATSAAPASSAPVSSAAAPTSSVSSDGAAGPAHVTDTKGDITSGTDYQNLVLFHHNVHRVNHSAPQLTWNDSLAASALSWASQCNFEHNSAGQNLAASAPLANVSAQITDSWYNNEIENYNPYYGESSPSGDLEAYGHATQVIWKGTETVGCATYDCTKASLGMWYTVCNYYPFGNVSPLWGDNLVKGEGAAVAGWME